MKYRRDTLGYFSLTHVIIPVFATGGCIMFSIVNADYCVLLHVCYVLRYPCCYVCL